MKKLFGYIKKNKVEIILFGLIILVASFIRFYRINRLTFFTYDQARDALFIKRLIVDHKFRLIGTQSSIPGLYTGPAYYYLMAPFLWLSRLDPAGIDFATALFGVLSVGLLFFLVKRLTKNILIAAWAGILFATQPQVVSQSRFAWNPNPTPFFFLLFLYGLFRLIEKKKWAWLFTFVSLAIILQLHYSAVCLIPVFLLFIFVFRRKIIFGREFFLSGLLFLVISSPLFFFDLRHNFINSTAVLGYLRHGAPGEIPPPPFFAGLIEKFKFLLLEIPFGVGQKNGVTGLSLTAVLISLLFIHFKKGFSAELLIILVTLISTVIVSGLFRGTFFSFYLTFAYPLGFLLWSVLLRNFFRHKFLKILLFFIAFFVVVSNSKKIAPIYAADSLKPGLKRIAQLIAQDLGENKSFNLVGIRGAGRYDKNAVDYRYFLETFYHKRGPDWDVLDYEQSRIVYMISTVGSVEPLKTGIWEVILFGPNKVESVWKTESGEIIYKLVR